jgi:hypothetical protein
MKQFIVLYKGPATPPDASHQGWPEWFQAAGPAVTDIGSPMMNGFSLVGDGTASDPAISLNGYSIVQAEDAATAQKLLASHPYLALGGYSIEVFEIPKK